MPGCTDHSCHENVQRNSKCVEEIKAKLSTFLTQDAARWGIGILVVILLAFTGAWGKTQYDVSKIRVSSAVQAERYGNILTVLAELKEGQTTMTDVHKAITYRMKNKPTPNNKDDNGDR